MGRLGLGFGGLGAGLALGYALNQPTVEYVYPAPFYPAYPTYPAYYPYYVPAPMPAPYGVPVQ